jgi:hypothetical protein
MGKIPDHACFRELRNNFFVVENTLILCQFSVTDPNPGSGMESKIRDLGSGMENPDPGSGSGIKITDP